MNDFDPEPRDSSRAPSTGTTNLSGTDVRARGGTYLLTWTTYGSWLRGDRRGFVGRVPDRNRGVVIHNQPAEPYDVDEPRLRAASAARQKGLAVVLNRHQSKVCVAAFREVADKYCVDIHAGAVMPTHVHLVVRTDQAEGPRLLNLFKGISSRRLGQQFGRRPGGSWWTRHGSRRLLPDDRAIVAAIRYVLEQPQCLALFGSELPEPPRSIPEPPHSILEPPHSIPESPHSIPEPPHSCGARHADGGEARDMNVAARAES